MLLESWKKKHRNRNPFPVKYVCEKYSPNNARIERKWIRSYFCNSFVTYLRRASNFCRSVKNGKSNRIFFTSSIHCRCMFGTVLEFKLRQFDVSHMASLRIWKWIDANLHGNGLQMLHWWIHSWTWVRAMLIGIKLINNWFYSCYRSSAQIIDKTFQTFLNFNQFPSRLWIYD